MTPQRIGGRVTATKRMSAVSPWLRSLMTHTPNMPRTQVTICGAPNAIAIPMIAPMHQPQDIRLAIAMPPNTMMRMTATGVSQARMLVCSELAPVKNGEACAIANCGIMSAAPSTTARALGHGGVVARAGLADLGRGTGLAQVAPPRRRGGRQLGGQHFDSHDSLQLLVECPHDHTEAPMA